MDLIFFFQEQQAAARTQSSLINPMPSSASSSSGVVNTLQTNTVWYEAFYAQLLASFTGRFKFMYRYALRQIYARGAMG